MEQLSRILASPQFREAPRLQSLLRFIVSLTLEGKAHQIKEATIASEVFGRAGTNGDSLVRSAAGRLRARLEDYYRQSGAGDPIVIVIPKGSYVPELHEREAAPKPAAEAAESRPQPSRAFVYWSISAAALVIALLALTTMLLRRRVQEAQQPNPEARELYLEGRYYWNGRTPEDLNRAVDYFTQAVVKDPRYAQAYAGLADTYNLLSEYTVMPYTEAFKRAIAAAKTAIQLDDKLAEAHNSFAFAAFYGDWDAVTAEREFRRALQLDPHYSTAHHWYATFLISLGRPRESLTQITLAQELEPSSKSILADKGLILLWAGQSASARALLEQIEAADPQFASPHKYLASADLLERRYADYLMESRKAALIAGNREALAITEAGEKGLHEGSAAGMFDAMLEAGRSLPPDAGTRYYWLAQISAASGSPDRAMHYLQLAFRQHDVNMVTLNADPCFARMRNTPAFKDLVTRVTGRRTFSFPSTSSNLPRFRTASPPTPGASS